MRTKQVDEKKNRVGEKKRVVISQSSVHKLLEFDVNFCVWCLI
jgi:hypothetical protein